jgi:ABC-type Zn uptake system ZnuABC Zn-binding protein ZnuA
MRSTSLVVGIALLLAAPAAMATVKVVATIYPLADLASQIGGSQITVSTLLPAGANPHTFEPTPAQMQAVAAAGLLVRVGAGLDDWAVKLLDAGGGKIPVVTITAGVELMPMTEHATAAHGGDPHVWLDPLLMRDQVVPALLASLLAAAPAGRDVFEENARQTSARLTDLDHELQGLLAPVRDHAFVAFHSAWRYFARRYALHEVGTVEPFPGKESSAREMAALIQLARAAGLRSVFIEPAFDPRVAEQIAREIGGRTYLVDPLGAPGLAGRDSYGSLMRYNARVFAEALQ